MFLLVLKLDALWDHITYSIPSYLFNVRCSTSQFATTLPNSLPVWWQYLVTGFITVFCILHKAGNFTRQEHLWHWL